MNLREWKSSSTKVSKVFKLTASKIGTNNFEKTSIDADCFDILLAWIVHTDHNEGNCILEPTLKPK